MKRIFTTTLLIALCQMSVMSQRYVEEIFDESMDISMKYSVERSMEKRMEESVDESVWMRLE